MQLRDATPDDAASLAAISIEVWLGTYIKGGMTRFFAEHPLSEFTAERLGAVLSDPAERVIVSCHGEGIDGFLRLSSGRTAEVVGCSTTEICTLYVRPGRQGAGVGSAPLDAGLHAAASVGAPSVWLRANPENTPALRFYAAKEFRIVGQVLHRIGDETYPNHILSRSLAGSNAAPAMIGLT